MSKQPAAGRPPVLADGDVIFINGETAETLLQSGSERRAVVNWLVDAGGRATVLEINDRFGYDTRATLLALLRSKWLGKRRKVTLPRRPKQVVA